jgi:nucleoside-diphosphate-sugar epimerase
MVYCVTGSAGHLGSHVVKALLERGDAVRALVLPGERCPDYVPGSGQLTEIEGDVRDASALMRLMEGCGGEAVVIHCAGIVEISGRANRRLHDVNVGGTENVLSACKQYGARRLVYVSSVHAIPILPSGQTMREIDAFSPDDVAGPYDKSKAEATQLVLDAVKDGLDAVCVHPAGIIGPHGNPATGLVESEIMGGAERLVVWPSPMSAGTNCTVRLRSSHSEAGRLLVFDARGRTIRKLGVWPGQDGAMLSRWDGRDARGMPVPAGVYFLRWSDGNRSAAAKVVMTN